MTAIKKHDWKVGKTYRDGDNRITVVYITSGGAFAYLSKGRGQKTIEFYTNDEINDREVE